MRRAAGGDQGFYSLTMGRVLTDTENRLLLLYAVERLGAVTAEQLLVFMVESDQMGYIPLQLGLAALVDAGLVRKRKHPLGTLYAITGAGRDALSMFEARLPRSRRAAVEDAKAVFKRRFRREKQQLAEFFKRDDGSYTVRLRLLERDADLLCLDISVPTHAHAQRFCDAWQAEASGVYAHIMRTLGEAGQDA